MNRKRAARTARIIEEAERHVGYRSQPNRDSAFQLKPYGGQAWNGTFIDRVLHDALGDFPEVRFLSTVTALGYFVKRNRVYRKPRPGDIVFFNFSADTLAPFEQPHVGVVVEVRENGRIHTIEGMVNAGTPQGSQLADGVFRRVRYTAEAIGFVRPELQPHPEFSTEPSPALKMSYFNSNPKTKARAIEAMQKALHRVTGAKFNPGKFDGETKAVLGVFSRERGSVENRGELTNINLTQLADMTDHFTVEP